MKLDKAIYLNEDVLSLARNFLGKVLCTHIDKQYCSGIITESEAYAGIHDRASHAWDDRRTKRTEPMYHDGGIAYVYLIYGMYSLFNIVTAPEGIPHAILVRAIQPLEGRDVMMKRRKAGKLRDLANGPGKLTIALGIHYSDTGEDLGGERIWIEDRGIVVDDSKILAGPRIGVDYAGEDALLPYRFRLSDLGDVTI
jgi:DNA-3-methyladenine glycosylase